MKINKNDFRINIVVSSFFVLLYEIKSCIGSEQDDYFVNVFASYYFCQLLNEKI